MGFRERSGEKISGDSWIMRNLWDNRVTKGKGWATIPKKLKSSGIKALVECNKQLRIWDDSKEIDQKVNSKYDKYDDVTGG